jgi:hypothetical protein
MTDRKFFYTGPDLRNPAGALTLSMQPYRVRTLL